MAVSSWFPVWFPENSDGPPVASGGEPVSSDIPPCSRETNDGPPVQCGGEPVPSEIPIGFPENGDGLPVASGGEPESSDIPTGLPENSDGPPVASGGEPVSPEIPIEFPENSDGQPAASGGELVSSEIPIEFPENSDGQPVTSGRHVSFAESPVAEIPIEFQENSDGQLVASGGQPVSSEVPTGFPEHSDGPPVASGGPSVAASSDGFPVDRVWTCLYPVHSGAPILDENVLDHFEDLVIWVERQKQNHMKWRTILNNHMTRRKELGGQICGMPLATNFKHERTDDGQMRTTIEMPCSFDKDDGTACGATAVSEDKASGIEQSSKRLFLSLLLDDAARNNPHSKIVLHDNAWKCPTSDIIKVVADQVVPHLANSPMPLTLPNRCQIARSRGWYEPPLDPGVREVEVEALLVEISVSCGWYRNTEGWVTPSNLPKLRRDGKTITPWMELARLVEPGKLLSFLRDRPDVFEVWCGLNSQIPKLLMYRCRTNPDDEETPRAARTQPPVAPVSTTQHVPPVAPSDVDVVQNPLASTLSEDPGDESRQEPPVAQEFQSPLTPDPWSQHRPLLPWPTRATKDTSEWLRIAEAGLPVARGLLPLCAGTCPPPPVCRPPGLEYPDAPPPPPEQMTAGTKNLMSLKCVGPPSQPVFTASCGQWWRLAKPASGGDWPLVKPPPMTRSPNIRPFVYPSVQLTVRSTPPAITAQMHRWLVAQACGQDAAGGACRCGQCEDSWFATGWTCPRWNVTLGGLTTCV